jgi:hypothetical protein
MLVNDLIWNDLIWDHLIWSADPEQHSTTWSFP